MRAALLLAVALSAALGVLLALREPPLVVRTYGHHAIHLNSEVLEVVPAWPENPAKRIEPIWASHFRRAVRLTEEG